MSKNNASIYVDNGNQRLVLWNVHSKAQKSIQVGNNNILTDDDTWLKAETDHSSLESDRGYGSMESEDNSLTDHEHDFVYPDKGMSQCSTKGALMTIFLDPIMYMYILVRILRLNPGSKEEHMFYQIGLGNKVDITLEGEYIICTFECFLEPVKRVLRFQIAPICYFLLRINPSKRFISMIERSRMATFDPSVKNINEQGAFPIEGMIKQDIHFARKYMPPYVDNADIHNQTVIFSPLLKSLGQNTHKGNSVYSYIICSDRILQWNGAGSNYGVKQNARTDDQLYCTGETQFDASRCPSQSLPTQWSDKEETTTSYELKARDICSESNVRGAWNPIYPHAADGAHGLEGKTPPIIASAMQQNANYGEGRCVRESRFHEIKLENDGNRHSMCSKEEKEDELRKTVTQEASTLLYETGHNKNCKKEESYDQSIKGPPFKYDEDVFKNHMKDGLGRRKETYDISNQEQSGPKLYGKDINTMGSLDRVKVTDKFILKQNHDKEISLKHLPTTTDRPDHLQQYLKMEMFKQLKKIPPKDLKSFLGYFHIDFHALNEDGLLCRTSHFGETNYAFQTNESAFKEFLVKMMQSVEICAGVFIKDPNDIEIDICKCGC